MPSCIVKGCSYSWKKKDLNVILHSFPNDLAIIKAWLLQTKQDFGDLDDFSRKVLEGKKTDSFRICSQHFSMDCYYQRGMITSLKKDALPTIFPENPFGINSLKKRVRISAPVVRPWADTNDSDIPTSIVMGIPLKIIKIEPDLLKPSTSSSIFPGQSPALASEMLIEKKKKSVQVLSPMKTSKNFIEPGVTLPVQKETQTVGTNTEYFPGQRHKSTCTDPNFVIKHKEVQTKKCKRFKCHCNGRPDFRSSHQDASMSSAGLDLGAESSPMEELTRTEPMHLRMCLPPKADSSVILPQSRLEGQNMAQGSYCVKDPSVTTVSVPRTSDSSSHFSKLGTEVYTKEPGTPLTKQDVKNMEKGLGVPKVKHEGVDCPGTDIQEALGPQDHFSENKYIVFDSCLNKLLKSCRCSAEEDCDGRITHFKKFFVGSGVSVKAECSRGHTFHMWDSQP
ncbi:uncharacterized protein LOC142663728 [Rhinoderma darwinii]|uniref:uncharacterized protein LOC142663728 n=1 Tax=Rhinoderma darwinii TaxID=43563 RepID=UPI003F6757BF